MAQKSTFFPRTFFGVISLVEISTFFPRTFFDIISMVKKSTMFPRTFINVISLVKKSKLFSLTLCHVIFDGQKIHVVCTYFFQQNFDGKAKIRRCFWLSCKLMKTFEEVFFVSNFKKLTFARFLFLKFSTKSPWGSPFL